MNKILYGIIGVLLTLGGAGINELTQEQQTNAYYCTTNDNVGVFDHLSSTNKTGYWLDENGTENSKVCRNGYWKKLTIQKNTVENNFNYYLCDNEKCIGVLQ